MLRWLAVRFIMRTVKLWARAGVLVVLLIASIDCARLRGRPRPVGPPLEIPPPPSRVIVPIESEPIVNAAPPPVEAPGQRSTRDTPRAAPAKPQQTDPAPAPSLSQPSGDPTPSRTLQTTANASEAEQKVRALLASAARDLGRIDYGALSVDAKAQYDIAKRFSEQAEEALKVKNLVFAGQLADKAAVLAALLLKR